jgi:hypothetical protein
LLNPFGHKVSGSYPAWATWARKLLAERTTTPVETGNRRRGYQSLQELARRQTDESRAQRAIT